MTIHLYPPLETLEAELLQAQANASPPSADNTNDVDPAWTNAPVPELTDFLRDRIHQLVNAIEANPLAPPAAGQIRSFHAIPDSSGKASRQLGRGIGVLLRAHEKDAIWRGWMVSAETDYASDRDLILETSDGSPHPQAGMVMTEIALSVRLSGDEPILAQLLPERMAAVIALSEGGNTGEILKPRPGHVFARDLDANHVGITGTPLGSKHDPRHAYQAIYRQLAEALSQACVTNTVRSVEHLGFRHKLRAWLFSPDWAPAPVLGIALAVIVAQGVLLKSIPPETEFRGAVTASQPCDTGLRLRIVFKLNAPQEEIVLLLRKTEARIIDGPSEIGEFWLRLPTETIRDQAMTLFKQSPWVSEAIPMNSKDKSCN